MGRPRANQLCKLSLLHFPTEAEQEQQPICLLVTTKVLYQRVASTLGSLGPGPCCTLCRVSLLPVADQCLVPKILAACQPSPASRAC